MTVCSTIRHNFYYALLSHCQLTIIKLLVFYTAFLLIMAYYTQPFRVVWMVNVSQQEKSMIAAMI